MHPSQGKAIQNKTNFKRVAAIGAKTIIKAKADIVFVNLVDTSLEPSSICSLVLADKNEVSYEN